MAEQQLPVWNSEGIEPPASLKNVGWEPGVKPPAQYFDWLFNRAYKCLEELQIITEELETKKAEEQDLTTLSNTVSRITEGTAIKEMTLPSGVNTVTAHLKSSVNIKRIDGKTIVNHAPLFDSGAWTLHANAVVEAPNRVKVNATAQWQACFVDFLVKANQEYTVSVVTNAVYYIKNADTLATIAGPVSGGQRTFTTPTSTNRIRVELSNNVATGAFYFENVSLVEGLQEKPFVANVKGLTNPTIVNETNGTSLVVPTTLYGGEYVEQNAKGELVKYKKWAEALFDDSYAYQVYTYTGNKRIYIDGPVFSSANRMVVKHNGTLLMPTSFSPTMPSDSFTANGPGMYITIPNADSGWGPNYTPTPEEIKAYFLGWIMYEANGGYTEGETYNGTGIKQWGRIGNPNAGATNTVPTVQAPIYGKWQPYRLIFELVTPIQEVIQPYSDLTLEKSDNRVKIYEGRIVNEITKPYVNGDAARINNPMAAAGQSENHLLFRLKDLVNVRRNNKIDKVWNLDNNTVDTWGLWRLVTNVNNFDPSASYTVDYEPLYTWEVTAPIDSVQLQFFETLQAVTNELVHDVAKQQDTVKRMLENVVNNEERLNWRTLTVVGFSNAYASYAKDSNGIVHVRVNINTGVWKNGEIIAVLPVGYRPSSYAIINCMLANIAPYTSSPMFNILSEGKIIMSYGTPIANGTSIANAGITGTVMFKAEN